MPLRRFFAETGFSVPQSHRQWNLTGCRLASRSTFHLPNFLPVRSSGPKSYQHPQDRVLPLFRAFAATTVSFPQSHRQSHLARGLRE